MSESLKKTPLAEWHRHRGAKMVPFGGWEMPVQYTGIVQEHTAVRKAAGLFDVSHMGEFQFSGTGAADLLERLTINDVRQLPVGGVQYSMFLNDRGGAIDDTMLYRIEEERYLAVVNASNIDKDWTHVEAVAEGAKDVVVVNMSDEMALVALQGPLAERILSKVCEGDLSVLPFHQVAEITVLSEKALVAASGYTGENGFEIFVDPDSVEGLMEALLAAGADDGILAAGLGARDTLRMEASLALYGHELDDETSPLEARLGFCVSDRTDYIGAEAIAGQRKNGLKKRLVMLEMQEKAIPRQGCSVHMPDGTPVGEVTSGGPAPSLEKYVAMAYVPAKLTKIGREYGIDIRGRMKKAVVVGRPFYKRPAR